MQSSVADTKLTVIYDGDCRFCIDRVNQFKRMDAEQIFQWLPRQDSQAEQNFPEIRTVDLEEGILVIDESRHIHKAADGIFQILKRLPRTRQFAWLYKLPVINQLSKLGYKIVAINRKLLGRSCVNNVCQRR